MWILGPSSRAMVCALTRGLDFDINPLALDIRTAVNHGVESGQTWPTRFWSSLAKVGAYC